MNPINTPCNNCGQRPEEGDVFCRNCGTALPLETAVPIEAKPTPQVEASKQKDPSAPLSLGDFMLIGLLLSIPVVNIIVLLLWAWDKKANTNRKNLARAGLIYMAISGVLVLLLTLGLFRAISLDGYDFFEYDPYSDYYDNYEDEYVDDFYEYFIGNPKNDTWDTLPFDSNEI